MRPWGQNFNSQMKTLVNEKYVASLTVFTNPSGRLYCFKG